MRRREFLGTVGALGAAWPLVARAQQPVMPVVGLVDPRSVDAIPERLNAFREGLKSTGQVEGDDVTIAYRFAENQADRLPGLVTELVRRPVNVIVTPGGIRSTLAAKKATATIPIVFVVSEDPVKLGLVASFGRPGGNLTGINFLSGEVTAKRLELLHVLLPKTTRVAVIVNPANAANTKTTLKDVQTAALSLGLQPHVFNASSSQEINAAFGTVAKARYDAVFVGIDPFFNGRRIQLTQLAMRHAIPTSYPSRQYAEAGGLMSYGTAITDAWHQAGIYAGRILKGAKPADLPVMQSSKIELVINAETARTLGIVVPPSLLALADKVIE